uniref:Fatty acid hydroxylase domain-containing protein n=1 Tax=Cannabis sativa TaxID=3483 RepID=A0A803NJD9_CANSA
MYGFWGWDTFRLALEATWELQVFIIGTMGDEEHVHVCNKEGSNGERLFNVSHFPIFAVKNGSQSDLALHHHYLYSRYHSHHHSSIVTEPITSVTHPFAELLAYIFLFSIPPATTTVTGIGSQAAIFGYMIYIDFMNNLGHCNFEFIPKWFFSVFPPLKYLMYTPSYV